MLSTEQLTLLHELEQFGSENEARTTDHDFKMLNILPETGEFLLLLVRALKAKRVLEIGTSNGYSTLWLAYAVQPLAEPSPLWTSRHSNRKCAQQFHTRAGMDPWIDARQTDAGDFLRQAAPGAYDFIFLDSRRDA